MHIFMNEQKSNLSKKVYVYKKDNWRVLWNSMCTKKSLSIDNGLVYIFFLSQLLSPNLTKL